MDVKTRIRNYFSKAIPGSVGDEEDVFECGLVTSLYAMQLVMFVEQEFSIVAERQDLDIKNFCSIDAVAAFVERKRTREMSARG
jgi:methoxymalonate biosynthesis acyl carrier protein